jgi:hypothetical protein
LKTKFSFLFISVVRYEQIDELLEGIKVWRQKDGCRFEIEYHRRGRNWRITKKNEASLNDIYYFVKSNVSSLPPTCGWGVWDSYHPTSTKVPTIEIQSSKYFLFDLYLIVLENLSSNRKFL